MRHLLLIFIFATSTALCCEPKDVPDVRDYRPANGCFFEVYKNQQKDGHFKDIFLYYKKREISIYHSAIVSDSGRYALLQKPNGKIVLFDSESGDIREFSIHEKFNPIDQKSRGLIRNYLWDEPQNRVFIWLMSGCVMSFTLVS